MENKFKEAVNFIKSNDPKKLKIILALGLIGILLIAFSDAFTADNNEINAGDLSSLDYIEYTNELENKLTGVISSIDGVGECKVMITLENSKESVYATDEENKTDDSSVSNKDEYVIYNSDSGETPVLIKEYYPKIQGVTVVCTGGDNKAVRETIINTVTSLFNISTNRVSVSKIKE